MTFVRQTGRLRDRCTVYACLHTRSCAQPDWNVNSNPDFDDSPSTPSPSLGVSGQCRPDLFEAFPTRSTGTNRTADQTAAIRPANNPVITFVTHAGAHFEKSLLEGSKANSCSTQAKRFSI
jgi:hypothetical protein